MGREDEIRLIAYQMWQEADCCHGRDVDHWLKAEMIWEARQKEQTAAAAAAKYARTGAVDRPDASARELTPAKPARSKGSKGKKTGSQRPGGHTSN